LIINSVDVNKDVDGFHDANVGKLVKGLNGLVAATAIGCVKLIKTVKPDLAGLKAVIVGRSNIVGKPVANLLLNEDCTVTIVHSKTKNLSIELKEADIVIAAVGVPRLIKKEFIKNNSIVIDVGINRDENNQLVGDVDFKNVQEIAGYITPVPGGVGPMTIACLLENTVKAACNIKNINYSNL
ncbi:MAG: bifunctional 5,10-methylenetetrahydrofolate dehydrogenase/5,10-methenyltetrahydrofolate cyclohydrolase, partial [Alphaproteobacteria bacterium]